MVREGWAMAIAAVPLSLLQSSMANGQTVLPEIVVTSPSPILTRPETPQAPGLAVVQPGLLPVVTDAFAPVTAITPDAIEREPRRSLGDLLFTRPGISASTYAPGVASRPIVRGLDNFRVRVQENGIGAQDVSELGEDHAVPIDPLAAERIEVIRGPATLRFGSQAIGGVVAAENNRVPTFIPLGGIAGRVSGGVSSVDRGRDGAVSIDAGGGMAAFHVDAFGRTADDYQTPKGRQRNSALDVNGHSVGGSLVGPSGFIGLAFQQYDALYGVPGGEAAERRTRLDVEQDKVTSKGEFRPDSGPVEAVRFFFGASRYKHNELARDEEGIDGPRATFRNREYETRFEVQHVPVETPLGPLKGAIGAQFGRRNISTAGEAGGLLRPTETRSFAAYLFEELAITPSTKLQAAGRIERAAAFGTPDLFPVDFLPVFTPTGRFRRGGVDPILRFIEPNTVSARRDFTPMSASFGILQQLPYDIVGSLNAQYVERAPASPELYSRGAHDATATFEIGDPNLKLESARTVEAGLRRATGPFRFDATGFYTRYSGFIYKRETGVFCGDEFSTCGAESELAQVVYTQRRATFYGAELSAQLDILPVGPGFVGLDGQYDFVRAEFDDRTFVPRIPPHRAGAGLFYRDESWFARLGFLQAFAHTEIAPLETPTAGYTLLKAEVSYRKALDPATFGFNEVRLGIVGDNLLDDDVRNSASFRKDEILLPGRNVRLFVTARF